jgi:hypothetical protein
MSSVLALLDRRYPRCTWALVESEHTHLRDDLVRTDFEPQSAEGDEIATVETRDGPVRIASHGDSVPVEFSAPLICGTVARTLHSP